MNIVREIWRITISIRAYGSHERKTTELPCRTLTVRPAETHSPMGVDKICRQDIPSVGGLRHSVSSTDAEVIRSTDEINLALRSVIPGIYHCRHSRALERALALPMMIAEISDIIMHDFLSQRKRVEQLIRSTKILM